MERREFLQAVGAMGLAATTGLAVSRIVSGGEEAEMSPPVPFPPKIDAEKVRKAALRAFLPEKKTCAESMLTAGCEALGLRSPLVPDIGLGLAGGVGLQGETCGAILGAAMVLSLTVAGREPDYAKKKQRVFAAAGKLFKDFQKVHGDTRCRKLCGLDLTTPEGRKALEGGVKAKTCAKFVETAARLLAEAMPNA